MTALTLPQLVRLRDLSADIRECQESLRALEPQRNALIREALASGLTHAQVAEMTGLTRGRIGQIAVRRVT